MTIREYRKEPCPICHHVGWCGRREDGLVLCKRPPVPPEVSGYIYRGLAKDGRTGQYVVAGMERSSAAARNGRSAAGRSKTRRRDGPRNRLKDVLEAAVGALTHARRLALAEELGLPAEVLSEVVIGWSDTAPHHGSPNVQGGWIFPEYDGQGRVIGTTFRFPAERVAGLTGPRGRPLGNKSAPTGFNRGLTVPRAWRTMPDPVLVVEGVSDVLAGRAVGLSVIGRPSNDGGVPLLAQACRGRHVIVLGENDRKPDGRWPGKEGAERVARKLETLWGRPVPVAFPPEAVKDLRAWIGRLVGDWEGADRDAVRERVLREVAPTAILFVGEPPRRRGGKVTVKAFRWAEGVEAAPVHADRLRLEDAAERRRFARAVVKTEEGVEADDLERRLLALQVPVEPPGKPAARPPSPSPQRAPSPDGVASGGHKRPPLPEVFLPGGETTILSVGDRLGRLLAETGRFFSRGGATVALDRDHSGLPVLAPLQPATLASAFERVAQLMCYAKQDGEYVPVKTICSEREAKLIQAASSFQSALPPIRLLSRCPVLVDRDRALVQIRQYDRESGILAFGDRAPDVPLEDAVARLREMLADFHFAMPSDHARALAAVITPALVFGGLLGGRAPVDLGEADQSQSGKGYRNKITAAVYRHTVKTVTQKKGGVGSLEESFATALIQGFNFVSLDNVRSALDSPAIESFLTEDSFLARVPHLAAVEVDPRRVIVQLTSNRASVTPDLANRSSCVRILKRAAGYRFRDYPEGDILDHVRANQSLYLGAVFAVVRAWHAAGKPRSRETRHDFRPWAQTLDWIVQHLLRAGPLLDDHRETQLRIATPVLNWLRDVALAVRNQEQLERWLRTHDLVEIISESSGVEIPGLPDDGDLADEEVRKKALQATGRRLALCFNKEPSVSLDGMTVTRRETTDALTRTVREYCFAAETRLPPCFPYAQGPSGERIAETVTREAPSTPSEASEPSQGTPAVTDAVASPLCAPDVPLCASAMETGDSAKFPYVPSGSVIAGMENDNGHEVEKEGAISSSNGEVVEPIADIGETAETPSLAHSDEVIL